MPCWPINKIKLQGKFIGYDTDDMIVFVEKAGSNQKCKILAQIKHSINITENNKVFSEVIQAAWNDFNNPSLFSRNKDAIVLITGPLSKTDVNDVRTILEWARHSENAEEFIRKVELTNLSSVSKQNKLRAFKINLKNANGGNPVSDEVLFEFLKHFHLLGYDLDIKAGITLSLLHSLNSSWIPKIREILLQSTSPITLKNGRWRVTERKGLWQALSTRLFDDNLNNFKQCIIPVLEERDPKFDLPSEERYASSIHGKVLKHSPELRKGLAETLALLGTQPDDQINYSKNSPKTIAVLAVREIFTKADWVLWGSLNYLLPILAEAASGVQRYK
ncbi:MAG: hypothetical protein ACMUIU_15670 [bacterium]